VDIGTSFLAVFAISVHDFLFSGVNS